MPKARYNEIVSFIRSGLRDQSISRTSIKWGIPVPGDEKHVIYVWFDALINYLTACGYPDGEYMTRYWPNVHHLVGKDIIRFHCVVWPIMLIAAGVNPPVSVFAHGWWTVEGEKMSKSKGNVVDPFEMVDIYGTDPFRYFLLREVPFGVDGDFSESAMVQRINSDLANDLGNLLNRTLQMIKGYRDNVVPSATAMTELDLQIKDKVKGTLEDVEKNMDSFAFDEALKSIWVLIGRGNKYIDETMPWKLGREGDLERLDTVLAVLYELLSVIGLLISPFIPEAAEKMWTQLGHAGNLLDEKLANYQWGTYMVNSTICKGDILFPRIDMDKWQQEKAQRDAKKGVIADPGDHESEIDIDFFKNLELRVAKITSVEGIPKANKLYKIGIDLGYEHRTIVSGLKEHFSEKELVGKRIIVVCNLKPAKLRGVLSNGMLLAASANNKSELTLLTTDKDIALGSRIS